MILIIGLGNPGKRFSENRHNIGFKVLDKLRKERDFSNWQNKKTYLAQVSEKRINKEKVMLVKPLTFMNNSGESIKSIVKRNKQKIRDIIVVHDDIDIPFGKIKISENSSSAGHKGVQSIIDKLKTKDFKRIRLGIKTLEKQEDLGDFVLSNFNKNEKLELKEIKQKVCKILTTIIEYRKRDPLG